MTFICGTNRVNLLRENQPCFFFSHGGGGRGREPFEYLAGKFFEQVGETVESRRPTGDEAKEQCRTLGKELVKSLN